MLRALARKLRLRLQGKGFSILDYLLAAYANPSLLMNAVNHVTRIRARRVESAFRSSKKPHLRSGASDVPVPIDKLIEDLSSHLGVLILGRGHRYMSIGVADVDLISALVYLKSKTPGVEMRIGRDRVNFGVKQAKRRFTEARSISITMPDENLTPFRLEVEAYRKYDSDRWISMNPNNRLLRGLYSDILETAGLYSAKDILGAETLTDLHEQEPIDVVYTWVDHNDPEWQKLFQSCRLENEKDNELEATSSADSDAETRFHNNDELKYSIRSVEQNIPWVRKIYIFTNCAKPAWLKEGNDRLVWVNHDDVIPSEFLPTFNSHVIETYLHHLPDLSERFVYLNDDVFIGRPLKKKFFFTESGQSRSMFEPYGMVSGPIKVGDPDYLNAARNSASILREELGFSATQLHKHTPFALQKSVLLEIEDRFKSTFQAMRSNKFRKPSDINLTSFFYHHYALATGRTVPATIDSSFIKSRDIRWRDQLRKAEAGSDIICINEGSEHAPASDWHRMVQAFLQKRFPERSSWE